jgi:glycosyltransferase involved in cell wall biosynthesis
LPPERSGISEYSAELLQELTRWYKIEVIVNQIEVADPWVRANIPIRDVEWFRAHWHCYDRALYHFGNSTFHEYMFDLLEQIPGVIVLHDFFLSGIYAYRENVGGVSNVWSKALYLSHGYASLVERYAAKNIEDVILAYPCNLPVLQAALGIIVHSEHSRALARHWYGSYMDDKWIVIPPLYKPTLGFERHSSREKLRINEEDFVIASFGMLAPTKLNHRLLNAFLRSPLAHEPRAYLIFVGENHSGEYGQSLNEMIRGSGLERRIRITGWVEPEIYQSYLAAVDVAVQLRSASRGEYSRAALDCMSHGLATVVNAHGSMAELDSEGVWKLPDNFTDEQLIEALTILWQDGEKRQNLGKKAQEITLEKHSPRFCASRYADAIEHFYNLAHAGLQGLKEELMSNNLLNDNLSTEDLTQLATCLARNFPPLPRRRQLLVDVSGIAQNDLKNPKNDIERATISILRQWLLNPPENWSIKPIYFTLGMTGYRYAQRFTSRILNINEDWAEDEPAEAWQSDVFISFNLSHLVPTQESVLKSWRNRGVSIWFVVYDFPGLAHRNWLETICHFNGAVCISEAVADELRDWLKAHMPSREGLFRIEWFPLGENSEVWLKQILTVFPSS